MLIFFRKRSKSQEKFNLEQN